MSLEYKGYLSGPIELDDGTFSGIVAGLRDVIHFEGSTAEELAQAFRDSVDDYLAWCEERGKAPEVPTRRRPMITILAETKGRVTTRRSAFEDLLDELEDARDVTSARRVEARLAAGEAQHSRMETTRYIALIDGEPGAYGVVFPDCPGCTAIGATLDEALAAAAEALADWAGDVAGAQALPDPRSIPQLRADPDVRAALTEGAALALVPLILEARRSS